jgi:hypothetical protein
MKKKSGICEREKGLQQYLDPNRKSWWCGVFLSGPSPIGEKLFLVPIQGRKSYYNFIYSQNGWLLSNIFQ